MDTSHHHDKHLEKKVHKLEKRVHRMERAFARLTTVMKTNNLVARVTKLEDLVKGLIGVK